LVVTVEDARYSEGRTLKTARAVLQVLRQIGEHPDGVTADDVADGLGKSHSTATYLLNSLVEEGFAIRKGVGAYCRYRLGTAELPWADTLRASRADSGLSVPRPAAHLRGTVAPGAVVNGSGASHTPSPGALEEALDELYARTGQRSYLAAVADHAVVILGALGRQGLAKVPGLSPTIRGEAHALAIGKIFLAAVASEVFSEAMAEGRPPGFTPATITDPDLLKVELARVRTRGYALDEEEFAEGICCVAAPVRGESGRLVAALGVSVPTFRFKTEQQRLTQAVIDVARVVSARSGVIAATAQRTTEEAM